MIDLYCSDCGAEIDIIYDQNSIKIKPCECAFDQGEQAGYDMGYSAGYEDASSLEDQG